MAACLAALSVAASASPAAASVTIGQLAPGAASTFTGGQADEFNPTVTSGNSYVVPGNGTIISWTHNAGPNPGALLTMKVFRDVAGSTWQVVGHDGPRAMVPAGTAGNTFSANIAVKRGDVLGINNGNVGDVSNAYRFIAPGNEELFHLGGLADGAADAFSSTSGNRMNITAVFDPTNTFSFGETDRNKKQGSATVTVNVPNDGNLTVSGTGAKARAASTSTIAVKAGDVHFRIKAQGKKRRQLNQSGKVKLKLDVAYTPTGGDPRTQSRKLKLKKG